MKWFKVFNNQLSRKGNRLGKTFITSFYQTIQKKLFLFKSIFHSTFVTGKFSVCPRVNKFYPDFIILLYDEMCIGKHCHYLVINLMIRVKLFDTICDNTIHLKWKTEADFHRNREQITLFFIEKHKRHLRFRYNYVIICSVIFSLHDFSSINT